VFVIEYSLNIYVQNNCWKILSYCCAYSGQRKCPHKRRRSRWKL